MKKFGLLILVCFLLSFCSIFKSKTPPYPSGVIFPLTRAGEIVYEGRIIDFMKSSGGNLYISTRNGLVYCLDGGRLKILWKFKASDPLVGPLSLGPENVYVYDINNVLYCLDREGRLLWRKKVKEKITSGAAEFNKKIYFGTEKGVFFALSLASGEELWRFQAGDAVRTSPIFSGNKIIFACDDHNLYILTGNGSLEEKIKTENKIQATPLVERNSVYFGTDDNYFYRFNLERRKKKWKVKIGGKIFSTPVVYGKRVFFLCWNNVLYCLNKRSGNILWWKIIPSRSFYRLEIAGERIAVSSLSSLLVCFDMETGEKVGDFDAGQEIKSNPLWLAPYLMINVYDNQKDEGRLIFLKKVIGVSLKSSKQSPQKVGEEITFTASAVGFFKQKYEFYLREGEKMEVVQEKSEKNSWDWFPEEGGNYIVGVKVVDEKENIKAEIPFEIKKD